MLLPVTFCHLWLQATTRVGGGCKKPARAFKLPANIVSMLAQKSRFKNLQLKCIAARPCLLQSTEVGASARDILSPMASSHHPASLPPLQGRSAPLRVVHVLVNRGHLFCQACQHVSGVMEVALHCRRRPPSGSLDDFDLARGLVQSRGASNPCDWNLSAGRPSALAAFCNKFWISSRLITGPEAQRNRGR